MTAQPVQRASRFVHASGEGADIRVSFEFFPPKTEEMEKTLWDSITRLAPLRPNFVSVTYGAGGSTRERTHSTVKRILSETSLIPAAHLTCVAATRDEIDGVIRNYCEAGVRHIVALRGDPISGAGERYAPHPGGYLNAADLVAGIRRQSDVEVSVSAYPEKHPDSPTVEADLDMLAAKVDAGATRAITQFFFENDCYFRYLDRVRARGIDVPVVPGILPVQNFKQTKNFAARCGASVPDWLARRFEGLDDDPATRKLIAAAVAAEQVVDLVDQGVTDFHFYTMNRADLVYAVCHLLGPAAFPQRRCAPSPRRGEGWGEGGWMRGRTPRPLGRGRETCSAVLPPPLRGRGGEGGGCECGVCRHPPPCPSPARGEGTPRLEPSQTESARCRRATPSLFGVLPPKRCSGWCASASWCSTARWAP